jgi:hypothetical protein
MLPPGGAECIPRGGGEWCRAEAAGMRAALAAAAPAPRYSAAGRGATTYLCR